MCRTKSPKISKTMESRRGKRKGQITLILNIDWKQIENHDFSPSFSNLYFILKVIGLHKYKCVMFKSDQFI